LIKALFRFAQVVLLQIRNHRKADGSGEFAGGAYQETEIIGGSTESVCIRAFF
jgi:hypothetical protein